MAHPIQVPRLGWSMEHGTFLGWLKEDGETVRAGEPLFRLEGDKAEQEIEAVEAGILHIAAWSPPAGAKVDVGATLGYLLAPGEAPPAAPAQLAPEIATSTAPQQVEAPPAPPAAARETASGASTPRARRAARERGVDWTRIAGTGRGGRVRERDVLAAAEMAGEEPAQGHDSEEKRA
jgi:pyruvate/2-oxoglutarate dehydrogenase complex dihydrolipoamide acyltransferase (E2) component